MFAYLHCSTWQVGWSVCTWQVDTALHQMKGSCNACKCTILSYYTILYPILQQRLTCPCASTHRRKSEILYSLLTTTTAAILCAMLSFGTLNLAKRLTNNPNTSTHHIAFKSTLNGLFSCVEKHKLLGMMEHTMSLAFNMSLVNGTQQQRKKKSIINSTTQPSFVTIFTSNS